MSRTFGQLSRQPLHRSFFRERLQRETGGELEERLVAEANARGAMGAVGTGERHPSTERLSNEELLVAILMPHTQADGRLFKLSLRMLQQLPMNPERLWFLARREAADWWLYWLLELTPAAEVNAAVAAVRDAQPLAPRGYRPPYYRFTPERLLKRAATKASVGSAARR